MPMWLVIVFDIALVVTDCSRIHFQEKILGLSIDQNVIVLSLLHTVNPKLA